MFHEIHAAASESRRASTARVVIADQRHGLLSAPSIETLEQRSLRQRQNMLSLVACCVSTSSSYSATTGWRAWIVFTSQNSIDMFLRFVHAHFVPSPYPFEVSVLGEFLTYLVEHVEVCGLSACQYLWAVRHGFVVNHQPVHYFGHPLLTSLRAACKREFVSSTTRATTKRLPFTLEMLTYGTTYLWCTRLYPRMLALVVALKCMITYLLRKSECIYGVDGDHYVKSDDVSFLVRNLTSGVELWCASYDAHKFADHTVLSMKFVVPSAKNDQAGDGYPYCNDVTTVTHTTLFCIVTDCFEWAVRARPLATLPFFSSSLDPDPFILEYKFVKDQIKLAAASCGFDPKRFGTHSCRIFGASVLQAAGRDNNYIQHWGRWKSLSFLDYIEWSLVEMESARASTCNPLLLSNEDLRRLHV